MMLTWHLRYPLLYTTLADCVVIADGAQSPAYLLPTFLHSQGHEDIIFCLDWDPVTRCAFSGGRESSVIVWDQAGTQKHK
jgi:WD40 repeat protein